ncbi:MAG TPA: Gfo/Idh/MocA family oxidoreductase [Kofleriaceae bacterium]|nr:Gfo/Idh/MocA family oxidoreductase [Kofleriaceae bacterium]
MSRIAHAAPSINLPPLDAPSEKPKPSEPLPDPIDKRLGVAVVGIGHLTVEQILPAFAQSKKTKLVALVSGDRKKAETVAGQMNVDAKRIYDYAGFDRIKDDPAIDAVYIVLPNHLHAEYTVRAAAAGKHVLCEKPMAGTVADAEKMVEACKRADRKLMIGYRIQYEPHNRFIMKAVRDKRFGGVRLVEGHNGQNVGDPKQWRLSKAAAGGALFDVGIYCLNTCRFVLGEEPIWVSGAIHSTKTDPRFREVDENVTFQLGFASGVLGSFSASFSTHISRRYRCLADHGGWIGADPAFGYDGLSVELSEVRGKDEIRSKPEITAKQQFAVELDHLATCVRENRQPYTPGEEGVQDMRIMEAILQSAREGRRIDLPHIAKLDAFRGPPPSE